MNTKSQGTQHELKEYTVMTWKVKNYMVAGVNTNATMVELRQKVSSHIKNMHGPTSNAWKYSQEMITFLQP